MTLAAAAFTLFAALAVAGALLVAVTRRPATGCLGLIVAVSGVSGLLVLLGLYWLAFWVLVGAIVATAGLFAYLARGLGANRALLKAEFMALRGLIALVAVGVTMQIGVASFGIRSVPHASGETAEIDPFSAAPDAAGLSVLAIALLLGFTGWVAARALMTAQGADGKKPRSPALRW
ncbi:MAG: hypothetical protein AAGF50_12860 [Pseudomonadota bacterium]